MRRAAGAVQVAALAAAWMLAVALLAGCGTVAVPEFGPAGAGSTRILLDAPAAPLDAAGALATLPVRPADVDVPGYRRSAFGRAWIDTDSDGCNQRDQVLARDMFVAERAADCRVIRAQFRDPYSGQFVTFLRGNGAVEIDHVVALEDAWQSGAAAMPAEARLAFATDTRNLQATSETQNAAKGSKSADQWLPPAAGFRCQYAAGQVDTKWRWHLSVTALERAELAAVLAGCPGQPLPDPAR